MVALELRHAIALVSLQNVRLQLLIELEHRGLLAKVLEEVRELLLLLGDDSLEPIRVRDVGLHRLDVLERALDEIGEHLAPRRLRALLLGKMDRARLRRAVARFFDRLEKTVDRLMLELDLRVELALPPLELRNRGLQLDQSRLAHRALLALEREQRADLVHVRLHRSPGGNAFVEIVLEPEHLGPQRGEPVGEMRVLCLRRDRDGANAGPRFARR